MRRNQCDIIRNFHCDRVVIQQMSSEFIFWLVIAEILITFGTMWGLYKLFTRTIRSRSSDSVDSPTQKTLLKSVVTLNKSSGGIKSTGFEPTLKTSVEPLKKDQKKQNFLDLLDELSGLDEDPDEAERNRRKRVREQIKTASSSGIEASASDETASQTFIGREPPGRDPGRIELELIIADAPSIKEK